MAWDPKIYLDFEDERTRPAVELLARVPLKSPAHVIDLGCGPGNSTALLARRWPKAKLEGLDSSEPMLDQARRSGIQAIWHSGDIPSWSPTLRYDVIFANAALHWLGDQDALLPRLMSYLTQSGVLAFQVPAQFQRAVAQADARRRSRRAVGGEAQRRAQSSCSVPSRAITTFWSRSRSHLDIWETTYLQVLDGEDPVLRWVSGTGLRPFVQALEGEEREAFVGEYTKRLNAAYPMRKSGKTLFPFQRIFVVARK